MYAACEAVTWLGRPVAVLQHAVFVRFAIRDVDVYDV